MADDDVRLRFSNDAKLRKQMRKRGITEAMIREAMTTSPACSWRGKSGPALRYTSATTGVTVLIDASTNEIFHVGPRRFKYDN